MTRPRTAEECTAWGEARNAWREDHEKAALAAAKRRATCAARRPAKPPMPVVAAAREVVVNAFAQTSLEEHLVRDLAALIDRDGFGATRLRALNLLNTLGRERRGQLLREGWIA